MDKGKEIFGSKIGAYKMLLDKFETLVALLRAECYIYDAKLETNPIYNEQAGIEGYVYIGKIKFTEEGDFEGEDGENLNQGGYTTVFKYCLTQEPLTKKAKKTKRSLEEAVWFLEKIS